MQKKEGVEDVKSLVDLFNKHKFSTKINFVDLETGIANVDLNFYDLTPSPIMLADGRVIQGSNQITKVNKHLDLYGLLNNDSKPILTKHGWTDGVLVPYMRASLLHGLTYGHYIDPKYFICAETALDYYFYYLSISPKVQKDTIDGVEYTRQIGIDVDEATKMQLLDIFLMHKTSEMLKLGQYEFHLANLIRQEIKNNDLSDHYKSMLNDSLAMIENVKSQAKLLDKSLKENLSKSELMKQVQKIKFK